MSEPIDPSVDIASDRREYQHGELRRGDLLADPMAQFQQWLLLAKQQQLRDATAMTLATVGSSGMPYQRVVLLKGVDSRGFSFFTNLDSRKARQIRHNEQVSLHFSWLPLDRQILINGRAEPLSEQENQDYFSSRPRPSQLAALASRQSQPISSRQVLEDRYTQLERLYAGGDVALPEYWGGYRIVPSEVEFWQGGERRLHDRFRYSYSPEQWLIERLAP